MRERLFPLATLITPNTTEASALLDGFPIGDLASMEEAAVMLYDYGSRYVLVSTHLRRTNARIYDPRGGTSGSES